MLLLIWTTPELIPEILVVWRLSDRNDTIQLKMLLGKWYCSSLCSSIRWSTVSNAFVKSSMMQRTYLWSSSNLPIVWVISITAQVVLQWLDTNESNCCRWESKTSTLFQIPRCILQLWRLLCRRNQIKTGNWARAHAQLNTLWRSRAISNPLKARLIQALIWPIVTYGLEAWTLNKELTGNIEAIEMQCYWRSMNVPYTQH